MCTPAFLNGRLSVEPSELERCPSQSPILTSRCGGSGLKRAGLLERQRDGRFSLRSIFHARRGRQGGLGSGADAAVFVLSEIASGELVVPCHYVLHNQRSYYLVYPEDKMESESLQMFCGWLREQAKSYREEQVSALSLPGSISKS